MALRDADVVTVRDRDGGKDLEQVTVGVMVFDLDRDADALALRVRLLDTEAERVTVADGLS